MFPKYERINIFTHIYLIMHLNQRQYVELLTQSVKLLQLNQSPVASHIDTVCACLLGSFFAKFGVAIGGGGLHQR